MVFIYVEYVNKVIKLLENRSIQVIKQQLHTYNTILNSSSLRLKKRTTSIVLRASDRSYTFHKTKKILLQIWK